MTSKYAYLIVVLAPFLFVNSRLGVKQGKDIAVMNEENLEQEENLKEEAPKEEEKLFTQEEVNEIIRHRLHERKKAQAHAEQTEEELQERVNTLNERENSLNLREERLSRIEYLKSKGYPDELADIIHVSEKDTFEKNVDKLVGAFERSGMMKSKYPSYTPYEGGETYDFPPVGAKHEPKYSRIR